MPLVTREYRVTVLDNLEPQVHRSGTWPSYANPKAEYVKGDVRDRSVFEPLVLASQAVVHFGAGGEYRPEHVPGRSVRRT
jgi:nucleoside-diphosphate-sugar epimerase